MFNECCYVGAQEVFAVAQTDDQWCVAAGCQHNVWLILVDNQDCEGTVQTLNHCDERGWQVAGFFVFDGNQVGGNFAVGVAGKVGADCG